MRNHQSAFGADDDRTSVGLLVSAQKREHVFWQRRAAVEVLANARDGFAGSAVAKDAFGADVVEHYLNRAKVEIDAFEAAVTDWERYRGFERL